MKKNPPGTPPSDAPAPPTVGRWVRGFLRHYLGGLYDRIGRHHVFFFAGGLSFSIFICVIPFGLILFSVLGIVIERSSLETQVVAFIDGMVPYPAYAAFVKGVVLSRIGDFIAHRRLAGYLGVAGLVLAASSLFASMRCVLNTVYEVEQGRNPVVGKLRDLGMILLVLLFFLVAAAGLPALEILSAMAERAEFLAGFRFEGLAERLILIGSFLLTFGLFFLLYALVPYERLGARTVAMSALWAAGLWELAKQGFGWYVANGATIDRVYGAYVMVVVVAIWVYYSSVVFLVAAEIGQLYRERWRGIGEVRDSWAI